MALNVFAEVLPKYPAAIVGSAGISVTKANGTVTIGLEEPPAAITTFDTRLEAQDAVFYEIPSRISVRGYSAAGDGGASTWKYAAAEPSHDGKFSALTDDGGTVWYEIVGPVICPRALGAPLNLTDDDAPYIQAAHDVLASNPLGGVIDLGPYSYRIKTTIEITANNIIVQGVDRFKTVLNISDHTFHVFYVTAGYNFNLLRLSVNGGVASTASSPTWVVIGSNNVGAMVKEVDFNNVHSGLNIQGAKTLFADVYMGSLKHGAGTGILMSNSVLESRTLRDVLIEGSPTNNPQFGIRILGGSDIKMDRVAAWWMINGMSVEANADNIFALWAVNCSFDNCTYVGLYMTGTNTFFSLRNRFDSCWFCSSKTTAGIQIVGRVIDTAFNGAIVCGNEGYGILVQSTGAKDLQFNGCTVAGNTSHGLGIAPGISTFSVHGGRFGSAGEWGGNGGYGIYIASGSSNNYAIVYPICVGNTFGAIADSGTGTNKSVTYI